MRADIYFTVYDWMRKKMGLTKTNLLVYAFCYNYFKNQNVRITDVEVCEFFGYTSRAALYTLKHLFNEGFIKRRKIMGDRMAKYEYWPDLDYVNDKVFNYEKK